jgi:membrane protease YdiL (CAAX protease family)
VLAAEDTVEVDRVAARRARGDFRPEALLLWLLALAGVIVWMPAIFKSVTSLVIPASFLGFFVMPALLAPTILRLPTRAIVRLEAPPLRAMLLSPLIAVGTFSLAMLAFSLFQLLWPTDDAVLGSYTPELSGVGVGWGVLLLTVLPGVCEEVLFRGTLMSLLLQRGRAASALLWQAVAFALTHVYVFKLAPTFVLGLALGWLTLRTRSIWPAIMVHALHNLIAVRGEPLLASMDLQGQLLALVGGLLLGGAALFGATRR